MGHVLPRRLARVLPPIYSKSFLHLIKANGFHLHLDYPYHSFLHCKGFSPAAPRKARDLISVPFSGLLLPQPVQIIGLVGLYPTNNLIRHRLIFRRRIKACLIHRLNNRTFQYLLSMGHYTRFPGFNLSER